MEKTMQMRRRRWTRYLRRGAWVDPLLILTPRETYYDMVVSGKIKMPRDTALQYYNIHRCVDGQYVLADNNENNENV